MARQFTIRSMSVVVVGSVAYDGVETPHGRVDRMLGGACTYIALAASYFTRVNIVAVVGEDFARGMEAMFQRDRKESRASTLAAWQERPAAQRVKEWFASLFERWL